MTNLQSFLWFYEMYRKMKRLGMQQSKFLKKLDSALKIVSKVCIYVFMYY